MNNASTILPGTRVRSDDGMIGTVERVDTRAKDGTGLPDSMIVRSDDGRWRYSIPLMLVRSVSQETMHPVATIDLTPDDLPSYILEDIDERTTGTAAAAVPSGAWTPPDGDTELRIPLAAEELTAHKNPIVLGNIHIHKGVEMVQQSMSVPVYHEEAIVEHIPADEYDPNAPSGPNDIIIPVTEERLVVEKRSVVKEYIRVRKQVVSQQQTIADTVRREFVEITEQRGDRTDNGVSLLRGSTGARAGGEANDTSTPLLDTEVPSGRQPTQ